MASLSPLEAPYPLHKSCSKENSIGYLIRTIKAIFCYSTQEAVKFSRSYDFNDFDDASIYFTIFYHSLWIVTNHLSAIDKSRTEDKTMNGQTSHGSTEFFR